MARNFTPIEVVNHSSRSYLEEQGIIHVVSRKNNPQTNGKVERFWLEYNRHKWRFNSMDDFVRWYNSRIHDALWLEIGENPEKAFIRKAPPESLIGLFFLLSKKIPGEGENDAFYMRKITVLYTHKSLHETKQF